MDPLSPEEIELEKKRRLLDRLKDRLAAREEEMADLRSELDRFEGRYTIEDARLYAEFDAVEAEIAEEEAKLVPDDEEIKKKAEELRRKAEESAARADEDVAKSEARWDPTPEVKKAYRHLARIVHPDLALDAAEKEKRHRLMAELNQAYSTGDQIKLSKLVEDYRNSSELVHGDSIGDDLVRAVRQISQVKRRLKELTTERNEAERSELYILLQRVRAEMAEGRDMLKQMAARTRVHIRKSERRLANLKNLNAAAEEYVKDKYGMDISRFRMR